MYVPLKLTVVCTLFLRRAFVVAPLFLYYFSAYLLS